MAKGAYNPKTAAHYPMFTLKWQVWQCMEVFTGLWRLGTSSMCSLLQRIWWEASHAMWGCFPFVGPFFPSSRELVQGAFCPQGSFLHYCNLWSIVKQVTRVLWSFCIMSHDRCVIDSDKLHKVTNFAFAR